MTFMSEDTALPYSEALRALDVLANSITPSELRGWLRDRVQSHEFDLLCLCEATEQTRVACGQDRPDGAIVHQSACAQRAELHGSAEFRDLLSKKVLPAMLDTWEKSCEMAEKSLQAACPTEAFDCHEMYGAYDFEWVPLFVDQYYDWANGSMNPRWVAATQYNIDSVIQHRYLGDNRSEAGPKGTNRACAVP